MTLQLDWPIFSIIHFCLQLAIGVEGGFDTAPKFDVVDEYLFVVVPEMRTVSIGGLKE